MAEKPNGNGNLNDTESHRRNQRQLKLLSLFNNVRKSKLYRSGNTVNKTTANPTRQSLLRRTCYTADPLPGEDTTKVVGWYLCNFCKARVRYPIEQLENHTKSCVNSSDFAKCMYILKYLKSV